VVIIKRKIVQRTIKATATPFQYVGDDGVDDVVVVIGGGGGAMMMMLESLLLQKGRTRAGW
jgi:hypothetical protein